MAWQIGVDVGGTFTDLLALDPERGVFRVAKVPSTPEDQSVGFIAGLSMLETDLATVAALVHGTTVATNAVLERKGARCGLITTAGFRDVLELGSTAALNGYVQPIVARYLGRLSQNLRSAGLSNELLVMQGNGGMMAAGTAVDLAVHTVMSGPAAGVIAAARIGVQAGHRNLIACDMGGTSFDVLLIAAGEPALSAEKDIAYGVPLRVPLVDIHTIGAGGGSIARITRAGLLQVGPESAGSRPRPIAYGRSRSAG